MVVSRHLDRIVCGRNTSVVQVGWVQIKQRIRGIFSFDDRNGIIVEMVQPGSPCIVKLMGNKLCIRDANLHQVLVRTGAVE